MRLFVLGMSFFHLCCASQQSSNGSRKILKPRIGVKIQSDISEKELNLLNEEQRERLGSSYIYLDDFVEEVDAIELNQEGLSSQTHRGGVAKNPLLKKKS